VTVGQTRTRHRLTTRHQRNADLQDKHPVSRLPPRLTIQRGRDGTWRDGSGQDVPWLLAIRRVIGRGCWRLVRAGFLWGSPRDSPRIRAATRHDGQAGC
jgi:hypothetical protein